MSKRPGIKPIAGGGAGTVTSTVAKPAKPKAKPAKRLADVKPEPVRQSFEDRHVRVTFHCPTDLAEQLNDLQGVGVRKSPLIARAIRSYLESHPTGLDG